MTSRARSPHAGASSTGHPHPSTSAALADGQGRATTEPLRVAVSLRVEDGRDVLPSEWVDYLAGLGATPYLVPNSLPDCRPRLDAWRTQAVLLSGGNERVPADAGPADHGLAVRDRTERMLVLYARARSLPVVGIGRSALVLNSCFGPGPEIDGHPRRRPDATLGVVLAPWFGVDRVFIEGSDSSSIRPEHLSAPLRACAWAEDGSVEAFHHQNDALLGLLWHPERPGPREPSVDELIQRTLRGQRLWQIARPSPVRT